MIIDISPSITEALAVWPGDTPPTREILLDMRKGDNLTLSTLHSTVHLGAHADAPSHFAANAKSIGEADLDPYIGPCTLVRVDAARGTRIAIEGLPPAAFGSERLLVATGTFPDPTRFNEDFAALEPDLIDALHGRGVRLIGVDTPSVDLFESEELPAHRRCLEKGVVILEGLVLDAVPGGAYELVALPLRLMGFDASPVRAVLRGLG